MNSFPTISLALIAKNEERNLPRLLDSVEGCFDEVILVDTGSTDKTKEIAESRGCKVFDFGWVNSFCKARNFAFSKATMDYVAWLDCDDVLSSHEKFIHWKKSAMQFADAWLATYHYALDPNGKPIISFVRERVFRRSVNPVWKYDLHEGIVLDPNTKMDYAVPWAVNHMRDMEDIKADKSRNIKILEAMKDKDARMQFYFGKELYEAGRPHEAVREFERALEMPLEHHDKVLAYQYAAYAAGTAADQYKDEFKEEKNKLFDKALKFAQEGSHIAPMRAEFYVNMGDIYLKRGQLAEALPQYHAAKGCLRKPEGTPYEGALYSFLDCYGVMPSLQIAKLNFNLGRMDEAGKEAEECFDKYKNPEAEAVLNEVKRIKPLITIDNNQEQTEDIIFTCPPQSAYEFDEEIYKTKGMGGSETALIEMAKELRELTGRKVKIFAMRQNDLVAESGVEYISNRHVNEYLSKFKPRAHIAWRHNIKLTNAPTYLWCHDLCTPSVETYQNFDKHLCLSEFHKNYVMGKQGLSSEKIVVTRNGLTPSKFNFERKPKNPNKLVFMSSPDRGLEQAMLVCDTVRESHQDIELHVYYGFENLYKYGLKDLAEKLKAMMSERPWVKYHGFTEQKKMYQEVSDAVIWCHPCSFIESYCITANEMLALGIFPVTRKLGAIANTLSDAESKGHAILLDLEPATHLQAYARQVKNVIDEKAWERIEFDIDKHSWNSIAHEWKDLMQL